MIPTHGPSIPALQTDWFAHTVPWALIGILKVPASTALYAAAVDEEQV